LNGSLLSSITYAVLYLVLVNYLDDSFKNKIISASILSGFLVALFGIAEHFGIDKHIWVQDVQSRVFSTLGQPNWLGAYLGVLIPLSIYQAVHHQKLILRISYSIAAFSFYICLLFTKSKSGIIASIISLAVFCLIYFYQHRYRRVAFRLGLFALLVAAVSLTINNPIKDRFLSTKVDTTAPVRTDILITPSEDIRKIVWAGAVKLWQQYPILGTGPETFAYSYYWTRPASHNLTSEWDFLYNKAHNEYLNFLATTGTLGLFSYLLIIGVVLFRLATFVFKPGTDENFVLTLAILASFTSILISNFAGFSVVIISLYFFLLPSLLVPNAPIYISSKPRSKAFTYFLVLVPFAWLLTQNLFYYLADITYAEAETYDSHGSYGQALNRIRISLSYRPDEPTYLIKAGTIAAKVALTEQNNDKSDTARQYAQYAINVSQKAIKISPFNLNLWKERSQIYYYLSSVDPKYYSTALQSLHAAAKLAPTDAKTFYLLGQFYQNTADTDSTIKYYQQAINLKPNYDYALFALGQIYYQQKKYAEAQDLFQKVLLYAPANTDAQDYLAAIATQSGTKK
jgi:O-antigen ligase